MRVDSATSLSTIAGGQRPAHWTASILQSLWIEIQPQTVDREFVSSADLVGSFERDLRPEGRMVGQRLNAG